MKTSAYILCALLTGGVFAADVTPSAKTSVSASKKISSLIATGVVVATDAVGNTITVKGKKKQWTFAVPANAKIAQGKKPVALMDITSGSKVVVHYFKDGDTLSASSIKVLPTAK